MKLDNLNCVNIFAQGLYSFYLYESPNIYQYIKMCKEDLLPRSVFFRLIEELLHNIFFHSRIYVDRAIELKIEMNVCECDELKIVQNNKWRVTQNK